ncbi:sodium:solute symporter family transporter (plasmid) [Alteromonas macleodii]|jgi:SSS family transporter|tara:strand:- start:930 stop:3536 length:2607 start_codon:yes stop_codon:yes gene_type:complete
MHNKLFTKIFHRGDFSSALVLCILFTLLLLSKSTHASGDSKGVKAIWTQQNLPESITNTHDAFMGIYDSTLVIAGGRENVSSSELSDRVWLIEKRTDGNSNEMLLESASSALPSPRALGETVSFDQGLLLIGGLDAQLNPSSEVLWLKLQDASSNIEFSALPDLPQAAIKSSALVLNDTLYVLVSSLQDTQAQAPTIYSLYLPPYLNDADAAKQNNALSNQGWLPLTTPAHSSLLISQNDGNNDKLYALSLSPTQGPQLYKYDTSGEPSSWLKMNTPEQIVGQSLQLNGAVRLGQSHFLLLHEVNGATSIESYNAITNAWASYPSNGLPVPDSIANTYDTRQVATWDKTLIVLKSNLTNAKTELWSVNITSGGSTFGWQNMTVLIGYLLAMVMVGVYFVFKNKNVNDYFRGGQHIPWWANACSMYATMLSSLTFVGIPAIVYRTDWLYWLGIWTILAVTPIAAYIAMPFFRKIDATSAYEYLSLRFNMPVRLFASGLFTLFHVSRMGIVMALTALALGAVTPFDVWQCVLIIGVLSLIYCTLGGIEAVIWTDTIQTIVLLLGAILCFTYIVSGVDGGLAEILRIGSENDKFRMVDIDLSMDSFTKLSIMVIILGGIGQNLSTYTADQSVVQRYMTTKDMRTARKSIWTNGLMAPVASALFFAIGTGLYVFYQYNPDRLDPTKQIDQIFPSFISTELPIGIAGLIIAGIFAAAQSTVSTSMNSMATTVVTDFMRPFQICKTEKAYLNAARGITLFAGILGTLVGLLFVSPEIRSLMEEYFKIVGMFMGALGGLFILGVVSTRANAAGAIIGLFCGVGTMIICWLTELTEGYLFGSIGIVSSIVIGYLASLLFSPTHAQKLSNLTIHTIK